MAEESTIPCPDPYDSANIELLRAMYVAHPESTIMRLIATVDCLASRGADAREEYRRGLTEGSRTMRAACSSMLRSVALQARAHGGISGVMGAVAGDYANSIDALPLPGGAEDAKAMMSTAEFSPAPGARGVVLHRGDGVMVCHVTLEPGASWPEETHTDDTETILRTAGELLVSFGHDEPGDEPMRLTQDCFAFVESKDLHTVKNASATESAEYISVLRRA